MNEIEEKFPVDEWVLDGMHIWPLLRINLGFQIDTYSNQVHKNDYIKHALNVLKDTIGYPYACLRDYKHGDRSRQNVDSVFLTSSTSRMFRVKGEWYDIFCSPFASLMQKAGFKSLFLEYAYRGEYRIPRFDKSIFLPPYLNYLAAYAVFFGAEKQFDCLAYFEDFIKFVECKGMDIRRTDILEIMKRVKVVRIWANYFKKRLGGQNPSVGLVIGYYGPIGMAFVLACHELGIHSVDIQHGFTNELMLPYGRWNKVPQTGYELLPDIFWRWRESDAGIIRAWNNRVSSYHKPIVGGNLVVDLFKDRDSDLAESFDREVGKIVGIESAPIKILVTLQPVNGLSELIKSAISLSPKSWLWLIRLHPAMLAQRKDVKKKLEKLNSNNWEVDNATDLPLYALLRHTTVHVTEFSSCVVEAEFFGVRSIITDPVGVEFFSKEISSGLAVSAFSPGEMIEAIELQAKKRSGIAYKKDTRHTHEGFNELLAEISRR